MPREHLAHMGYEYGVLHGLHSQDWKPCSTRFTMSLATAHP